MSREYVIYSHQIPTTTWQPQNSPYHLSLPIINNINNNKIINSCEAIELDKLKPLM